MSLRETLDAAKREAQEGGSLIFGKDAKDAEAEEATATRSNKRSAANAKPTRERAANVRVVSSEDAKNGATGKKESEMSKEERKAAREEKAVCFAAYESASGERALALANATDKPQRVTGEWKGRTLDITLPPHDLQLVK